MHIQTGGTARCVEDIHDRLLGVDVLQSRDLETTRVFLPRSALCLVRSCRSSLVRPS
jgi:hypothetical protein